MCHTDLNKFWEILRTRVYSAETQLEARNRIAEFYYGDCRRLAGKLWVKNRLPRNMGEDFIADSMVLMIHSVIPAYTPGSCKFSSFLTFCLKRRLKQYLRTRFNRDSLRSVELQESTANVPPIDMTECTDAYEKACRLFGERVVEGRVMHGWSVEKMAEELGVTKTTVYNWMGELREILA